MKIELNKMEIELIDKALEIWEREAQSSTLASEMLGVMLCPKEKREEDEQRRKEEFKKAEDETRSRRMKSILIRAKLLQALARESEHDVGALT